MIRMPVAALLRGVAPVALLVSPALVVAQTAPAAAPDSASNTEDQDIVVVGTAGGGMRRQDAAFAVTTISAESLERAAPSSTADLLRSIPGVSAESSGGKNGANIFVRGYPSGGDATFVTFQMGGVPVFPPPTLSFLENSQLIRFDDTVQRVEAVRGGTGSLFSNGQPGLTVNVVQRTAGDRLAGGLKASITDYGELRGDAWVSTPLDASTGIMIGGYYNRGTGLRDPGFNTEKGGQITANLTHDFNGRGSLLVFARYLDDRGQWLLPIPVVTNGTDISQYGDFNRGDATLMGPETRVTTNLAGQRVDLADGRGAKVFHTGISFDYELADGLRFRERVSYLGGHADTYGLVPAGAPVAASAMATTLGGAGSTVGSLTYVNGGGAVATGANTPVMRAGIWSVQKEITSFVADTGLELTTGRNKLTGGFYFADYTTRDTWSLGNQVLLTATPNARLLNMTLNGGRIATSNGFTGGATYLVRGSYTGRDYAFYAVDELQVTDQLRLDGGIRWQRHEITGQVATPSGTTNRDGNVNTLYDNAVSVLGNAVPIDYSDSAWSWTVGANYDITSQVGVFARYSKGRSFPQFDNMRGTSAADIANHRGAALTASVETFEGGLKMTTDMVSLYATLFHNRFTGLSSSAIINNVPTTAIGGAKATGVEIEGALRPFPGLSLGFGGTWMDATYKDYFTGGGAIDNTGNRVQRQPRWSWRVQPAYELEFGNFRPSVFATLAYTGDRFSDPENLQRLPNFTQLDAGVAFEVSNIKFQVTANNLTNSHGLTEGNPRIIGSQGTGAILARPILGRSFRFSAAVEF
jgi:outer membrane receptor protein involved in Fe transport